MKVAKNLLKKPGKPRKIIFVMYSFQFGALLGGCSKSTLEARPRVSDVNKDVNHGATEVT